MSLRIIALGSEHGDDRVGFAVLEALHSRALPPGCTLHACAHPATELIALLAGASHAVLVDAVVDGGSAGRVRRCEPGELAARPASAGSHGLSVDSVLVLAAALGMMPATLTLLGVTIEAPLDPHAPDLSPPVRAAVPALVEQLLALAHGTGVAEGVT